MKARVMAAGWLVAVALAAGPVGEAAEKVTLLIHPTLYNSTGGDKGVVAEFTKQTGIEVQVVTAPYGAIREKAMIEYAAGSGRYDVTTMVDVWINQETAVFLEPLDEWVKKADAAYDFADIIPSLAQGNRVPRPNGPLYAIPFRVGTGIIYYRKDLFEKHKVKVPETWDEFLTAAQKLTLDLDGDGKIDVYGSVQRGKPGEHVHQDFLRFLHSTGHGMLDDAMKRCLLVEPDAVRALEVFVTVFQKKWAPPDMLAWGREEYVSAMQQGRAAMGLYFSPYWGLMIDRQKSKVADHVGYALVPAVRGGKPGRTQNASWNLVIDRKSRNKAAAWKLMEALTNKPNQLTMALKYANGPVRASSYTAPEYLREFPVAKAWLETIALSTTDSPHPRQPEMADIISEEVIAALQAKKTPKVAMESACKRIEPLLR